MTSVGGALSSNKKLRVMGFDDSPFSKERDATVNISGVLCSDTRFEGMLWGSVQRDGVDATNVLIEMVTGSKFHDQLHAILLDGIAFGGFNIVDLPKLSDALDLPCIAVMRKRPNLSSVHNALKSFNDYEQRAELITKAGAIHEAPPFYFQCMGIKPHDAEQVLMRVTDTGKVPEALRLAHLIGFAVKNGVSSNRA